MNRISLVGYRGTGKSTVARLLADRLGWSWVDADALLEKTHGKSIQQIFADEGEPGFRDKESSILQSLATLDKVVIATGGGVILRPENRTLLAQGKVVWLTGSPEILWKRIQADETTSERRPNLAQGGLAEVTSLLAQRQPLYASLAHRSFDTDVFKPAEIAAQIHDWLLQPPSPRK